jgi:hypothetical protein
MSLLGEEAAPALAAGTRVGERYGGNREIAIAALPSA